MNEMESSSNQVKNEVQSLGFYEKFIGGDFGLAKTYWLLGAMPALLVNIAMRIVSSNTFAYCVGAALVCYQTLLLRAILNAGRKYKGSKVWPVLAFLMVGLAILGNIRPILEIGKH